MTGNDGRTDATSWDAIEKEEVLPGIFRQTVSGVASTITRYIYQPGSVFPQHHHPEEQITVVHEGSIEFDVGGRNVILRAGDLAVIPAGVPHGARVVGDEAVVTDNYLPTGSRTPLEHVNGEAS